MILTNKIHTCKEVLYDETQTGESLDANILKTHNAVNSAIKPVEIQYHTCYQNTCVLVKKVFFKSNLRQSKSNTGIMILHVTKDKKVQSIWKILT